MQVIFRNMDPSPAIEDKIRKEGKKLMRYYDHVISCRVAIELHHRHHHKGKLYHVRIDLTVPNAELVANREPPQDHTLEDVYVAIRDAFAAIKRQLQDYVRKQRGDVKHHESPLHGGYIAEIAPLADYGYIESLDGRRLRFTSNSVINCDFNKLKEGDSVRFIAVISNEELAASTVYLEGKHHIIN